MALTYLLQCESGEGADPTTHSVGKPVRVHVGQCMSRRRNRAAGHEQVVGMCLKAPDGDMPPAGTVGRNAKGTHWAWGRREYGRWPRGGVYDDAKPFGARGVAVGCRPCAWSQVGAGL